MARKSIDITGKRFGRLVAIKEIEPKEYPNRKQRQYLCQCDCGKQAKVLMMLLRGGQTKSCGCARKEKEIEYDLTGRRFGKLTVVKIADERNKNRALLWVCACDCGNVTRSTVGNLINGSRVSCGCEKESDSPTKIKGVSYNKQNKKYKAYYKRNYLGLYETLDEAARIRKKAERGDRHEN